MKDTYKRAHIKTGLFNIAACIPKESLESHLHIIASTVNVFTEYDDADEIQVIIKEVIDEVNLTMDF